MREFVIIAAISAFSTCMAKSIDTVTFRGSQIWPTGFQMVDAMGVNRTLSGISSCSVDFSAAGPSTGGIITLLTDRGEVIWGTLTLNETGALDKIDFYDYKRLIQNGTDWLDSEGLAFAGKKSVAYVSTEESVSKKRGQSILAVSLFELSTGAHVKSLPIPSYISAGIKDNLGFEALLARDNGQLLTASEMALATGDDEHIRRVVRWTESGQMEGMVGYLADETSEGWEKNTLGLVEFARHPFDASAMLAMERTFSPGLGNDVRLYEVTGLETAPDVADCSVLSFDSTRPSLCSLSSPASRLRKRPLLRWVDSHMMLRAASQTELEDGHLNLRVDNYEAMCLLPRLPGADPNQALLLMINDDNANPAQLGTQAVLLSLTTAQPPPQEASNAIYGSSQTFVLIAVSILCLGLLAAFLWAIQHFCGNRCSPQTARHTRLPTSQDDIYREDAIQMRSTHDQLITPVHHQSQEPNE